MNGSIERMLKSGQITFDEMKVGKQGPAGPGAPAREINRAGQTLVRTAQILKTQLSSLEQGFVLARGPLRSELARACTDLQALVREVRRLSRVMTHWKD